MGKGGSKVRPMINEISCAKCQNTLPYFDFHIAVSEPLDADEIENVGCCYFR